MPPQALDIRSKISHDRHVSGQSAARIIEKRQEIAETLKLWLLLSALENGPET
jgi:hypothetical protein